MVNAMKLFGNWFFRLFAVALALSIVLPSSALAATLNFNSNNGNSNNAVLSSLNDSDTCSGNWSYSGSVFTCNGSVVFDDGDDIRTNLSSVTIRAEAGIRVRDNSVGTANNRINLQTTYGLLRVDDESVVYGNLSSTSGGIQITGDDSNDRASIIGSLSSDASINATEADITGTIQTTYGDINFDDVNVTGNITSSSGNLDFDDGDVTGTITTGGSATFKAGSSVTGAVSATNGITATNTVFGSTLTANSNISLTGGSVAGQVWSQSNGVTTNNTTLNGGARSQSTMNITGGTVQGAFIFQSANPMTMTNVNFTSGSISGPSTANIVNSTLGSSSSSLTVTVATNDINVTGSTVYANMTAPGTAKITNSTYTGDISVNTGKVELDNSVVTGNVSSSGNDIDIKNGSTLTGNATAGNGKTVKVYDTSQVQGQCQPARDPETACGSAPAANFYPYWNFNQAQWSGASGEVLDSFTSALHGRAMNGATTASSSPAIPTSSGLGTCEYSEFSGTGESVGSQFVLAPYSSSMNSANTFSVAFWMKMPSAAQTGDIQSLMTFGLDRLVSNTRFSVYRNTSGNLTFLITMADNSFQSLSYSTNTAFNGSWNHIAASYNVSSRQMKLYVNGSVQSFTVPPSANSTPKNISSISGAALGIGALPNQTFGMTGQMDNARFYNKELTQNEINALMTETSTCSVTPAQPTQLFWNFNQSSWTGAAGEVTEETTPTLNGTAIGGAFTADISPALVANSSGGTCEYGNFTGTGATANSSLVQVPLNSTMNSANSFSLAFWMKMQGSSQQGTNQIFTAYGRDANTDNLRFVVARIDGYLAFIVTMADNSTQLVYSTNTSIFNNNWQHIAATYSYSDRRVRIYVNGTQTQTQFSTSNNNARTPKTISSISGSAFGIGALPNRTYGMTGQMDNVRFYNKELNSTEVSALSSERSACVSAEPVLSWNLNVASWTGAAGEVLDTSGNSLSGSTYNSLLSSITAPALTGDPGTCSFSQFNGTDQYIAVADNAKLDIADELTVAIWVRPKAYPGSGLMTILSKDTNYEFHIMPDGKINWWWHDQDGVERTLTSNGSVPLNQWTHVAITYKNGAQRIYLNGSVDSSIGSYTKKLATNNLALEVGRDNAANRYFNGDLDEVRIYAKSQNPVKIEEIRQERASCSLIASCLLTEEFNDYTQWYRTVLSGTTPEVVNGRLQLTNNGTYQSTAITFKQGFPTAGNKLTIEFDHFAYGGNGADGIGLVLSDATVTPVPGSFGGSLGYAPRNTVSPVQPGFAGGWLGIGFDEFGNYAKATEGRTGGVANNVDSAQAIGVRGAGSGSTGYSWLGWSTKLSRSLSISGNTPGRGDRFRITLDTATNAGQVSFSLQRREAGGSTFTEVLNSSTINLTNQPAMPSNFLLSFTGSTGANTNFHAIDNVQVCSFKAPVPVAIGEDSIHHFELSYDNTSLTCSPTAVTVKACANSDCSQLYANQVSVQLTANNNAVFESSGIVTFTGSQTINLTKTGVGVTTIGIQPGSASVSTTSPLQCKQGGAPANCSLSFADSGFVFDVQNMVANQSQNVLIKAVRKDDSSQRCVPGFKDVTRNVKLWSDYIDPSAIGRPESRSVLVNGSAIAQTYGSATTLDLAFNSLGQATIALNYIDAGQMQLNARYDGSVPTGDNNLVMTGSDLFVSRPAGLCIQEGNGGSGVPLSCASPYSNCAAYKKAGEDFSLAITAKAWANDVDTNFCANQLNTPNFRFSDIPLSHSLIAPTLAQGGSTGSINATEYDHVQATNGTNTVTQRVSEAGVFSFSTPALTYFGLTIPSSTSHAIGRFIPAYFEAEANTPALGATCGTFEYLGKELSYSTNPVATLTAKNIAGNVTKNYGGAFFRASALAANATTTNTLYSTTSSPAAAIAGSTRGTYSLSGQSNYDGVFTLTLESDTVNFYRTIVPAYPAPFIPDLGLSMPATQVADSDAVCIKASAAGVCENLDFGSVTVPQLRYGRLVLKGGSVAESTAMPASIPVVLTAEYWNGSSFVLNSEDNCSAYAPSSLLVTAPLTNGGTAGTLVNGVNVADSLSASVAANTVGNWPVFYQAPPWLKFDWSPEVSPAAPLLENPSTEVSVGRFRGNKRQIFWQERLN